MSRFFFRAGMWFFFILGGNFFSGVFLLHISNKGASITRDGFPLDPWWLIAGLVFGGLVSWGVALYLDVCREILEEEMARTYSGRWRLQLGFWESFLAEVERKRGRKEINASKKGCQAEDVDKEAKGASLVLLRGHS